MRQSAWSSALNAIDWEQAHPQPVPPPASPFVVVPPVVCPQCGRAALACACYEGAAGPEPPIR